MIRCKCDANAWELVYKEADHSDYYRCTECGNHAMIAHDIRLVPMVSRIGAICDADEEKKTVRFFGYGIYGGRRQPPEEVYFLGEPYPEGRLNPCMLLDNGDEVFGCECWWGSETEVKKKLENQEKLGLEIVEYPVAEYRKRAKEQAEEKQNRE